MKERTVILIIAVLVLLLCAASFFIGRKYAPITESVTPAVSSEKYIYDTTIYITKPESHHFTKERIRESLPDLSGIDSQLIAEDYFARYVVTDTITDSLLTAIIIDTISKNQLQARSFQYRILKPTAISTEIVPEAKARNKLYLGGFVGYDREKTSLGISPTLLTKTNTAYSLDVDLSSGFPDGMRVRVQKLISFGKK